MLTLRFSEDLCYKTGAFSKLAFVVSKLTLVEKTNFLRSFTEGSVSRDFF